MSKIISDIIILLLSILKYPFIMMGIVAADSSWHAILSNIIGGIIGIFLFTFFGAYIEGLYLKIFPTKKFSRKSRALAYIKDKFGVWGVALSSILLTVPLSILVCLSITNNRWEVIKKMIISLSIWTIILNILDYLIRHL